MKIMKKIQKACCHRLRVDQQLVLNEMKAIERFTRPAATLYRSFTCKKTGRTWHWKASTYAPTISTILKRSYVEKRDKEGVKRNYRILVLKE